MAETQSKQYHIGQKIWKSNVTISTDLLDGIKNVVKFGITTMPGVKFILNTDKNATNDTQPRIEIGRTGFFELDVKDLAMTINSITVVDSDSADIINENYCYIDFIYYTEKLMEV